MINDQLDAVDIASHVRCEPARQRNTSMSLSYLQLRLKQNEEDFARISGIDLDPNIKDVQKK